MKKQQGMISKIIVETAKNNVSLPWARGTRRAEWIAKRAMQASRAQAANS